MKDRYIWIPEVPPYQWTDADVDRAYVFGGSLVVGILTLAVSALLHAVEVWP